MSKSNSNGLKIELLYLAIHFKLTQLINSPIALVVLIATLAVGKPV